MRARTTPPTTCTTETPHRKVVAQFLVNGTPDSAEADRAERIARAVAGRTVITYRRGFRMIDIVSMVRSVRRLKPHSVYSIDLVVAPTITWLLSGRRPFAVDAEHTPRFIFDLTDAPLWARWSARVLERISRGQAEPVTGRDQQDKVMLVEAGCEHLCVVSNGDDLHATKPMDLVDLRARLNLSDVLTVGVQARHGGRQDVDGCLGWDLVQAIGRRPDLPIHAILSGGSPGIAELRRLARKLNISDRLHVAEQVSDRGIPNWLSLCDVVLVKQTNESSGGVEVADKFATYIASSREVLASRGGTAEHRLPERHLVDFVGQWDHSYPDRLADRLADTIADRIADRPAAAQLAIDLREPTPHFNYDLSTAATADEVMVNAGTS